MFKGYLNGGNLVHNSTFLDPFGYEDFVGSLFNGTVKSIRNKLCIKFLEGYVWFWKIIIKKSTLKAPFKVAAKTHSVVGKRMIDHKNTKTTKYRGTNPSDCMDAIHLYLVDEKNYFHQFVLSYKGPIVTCRFIFLPFFFQGFLFVELKNKWEIIKPLFFKKI